VDIESKSGLDKYHRMLDKQFADEFCRKWIDAWNAHDLQRILTHYSDDFEMTSPLIAQVIDEKSGRLKGKPAIEAYWRTALALVPDLHFTPRTCFIGVDSLVIQYESSLGRQAAETFVFNAQRLVSRASAHYI
jgi:hypothetical protein